MRKKRFFLRMTAEYDPEVNVIPVLAVIKTFGKCMKEDGKFHKAGDYKIAFGRLLTACGNVRLEKSRLVSSDHSLRSHSFQRSFAQISSISFICLILHKSIPLPTLYSLHS